MLISVSNLRLIVLLFCREHEYPGTQSQGGVRNSAEEPCARSCSAAGGGRRSAGAVAPQAKLCRRAPGLLGEPGSAFYRLSRVSPGRVELRVPRRDSRTRIAQAESSATTPHQLSPWGESPGAGWPGRARHHRGPETRGHRFGPVLLCAGGSLLGSLRLRKGPPRRGRTGDPGRVKRGPSEAPAGTAAGRRACRLRRSRSARVSCARAQPSPSPCSRPRERCRQPVGGVRLQSEGNSALLPSPGVRLDWQTPFVVLAPQPSLALARPLRSDWLIWLSITD